MDNLEKTIKDIQETGKLFEVGKVTKYRGYRTKDNREIEVTITDYGEEAGNTRYFVEAVDIDNPKKIATGNGAKDIHTALCIIHWGNLD